MSDTPLPVMRALSRAGFSEVEGSSQLWRKGDAAPVAWEDALLVLAETPATNSVKPGWKTTELWAVAAVVLPALTMAVETLQGNVGAIPEYYRAPFSMFLLLVSALLSGFYAQVRTRVKGG